MSQQQIKKPKNAPYVTTWAEPKSTKAFVPKLVQKLGRAHVRRQGSAAVYQ